MTKEEIREQIVITSLEIKELNNRKPKNYIELQELRLSYDTAMLRIQGYQMELQLIDLTNQILG